MQKLASQPFPRLVGDIGGTNIRFAVITAAGSAPAQIRSFACASFPGPEAAILHYLASEGLARPPVAAFGIATPLTGDAVRMTNHPWAFSIEALRTALGLRHLVFINDFTALALALPRLGGTDLEQIGGGTPQPGAPLALLGAGTGLGVSGLIPCGAGWQPLAGEGGHVSLAAGNAREAAIIAVLAALRRTLPSVAAPMSLALVTVTSMPAALSGGMSTVAGDWASMTTAARCGQRRARKSTGHLVPCFLTPLSAAMSMYAVPSS